MGEFFVADVYPGHRAARAGGARSSTSASARKFAGRAGSSCPTAATAATIPSSGLVRHAGRQGQRPVRLALATWPRHRWARAGRGGRIGPRFTPRPARSSTSRCSTKIQRAAADAERGAAAAGREAKLHRLPRTAQCCPARRLPLARVQPPRNCSRRRGDRVRSPTKRRATGVGPTLRPLPRRRRPAEAQLHGTLDRDKVPASYRTLIAQGWVHYLDYRLELGRQRKACATDLRHVQSQLWKVLAAGTTTSSSLAKGTASSAGPI